MGIFGSRDTFRDVRGWYSRLALLEQQICRIERLNGQPLGTGFLVAHDLVMTADHVITPRGEPVEDVASFVARFDFATSPSSGVILEGAPFTMAEKDWLLGRSPPYGAPEHSAVDTALVRLAQSAGLSRVKGGSDIRGWVDLTDGVVDVPENSGLAIMQHPEGRPLKLSLNTQAVLGVDTESGRLMYRTDTLPGSSGAPCFDIDWKFVAMHEGRDVRGGNHNRGIPFSMIRHWLEQQDLWRFVSEKSPVAARIITAEVETGSPAKYLFAMPPQLKSLIAKGEGQLIEFKNGIAKGEAASNKKVHVNKVLSSVAAFMNSPEGGNVVIGMEDDGSIVGVQDEYILVDPQSANWDGYDRYLNSVLTDRLDVDSPFNFFNVARYHEDGKDICVIHIEPSDRPVFLDDLLYVRVSSQNRPLKGRQMLSFVADRWSWLGDRKSKDRRTDKLESVRTGGE
jgi:Trypsin-like peptidase domain/Putative DNA-binding domain